MEGPDGFPAEAEHEQQGDDGCSGRGDSGRSPVIRVTPLTADRRPKREKREKLLIEYKWNFYEEIVTL